MYIIRLSQNFNKYNTYAVSQISLEIHIKKLANGKQQDNYDIEKIHLI